MIDEKEIMVAGRSKEGCRYVMFMDMSLSYLYRFISSDTEHWNEW